MKALVRKMERTNTGMVAENGNFHSTAEKDKNYVLLMVYFIVRAGSILSFAFSNLNDFFFPKSQ